jgi:hypothetical protein
LRNVLVPSSGSKRQTTTKKQEKAGQEDSKVYGVISYHLRGCHVLGMRLAFKYMRTVGMEPLNKPHEIKSGNQFMDIRNSV